jgi:uncharacterized integral membrane protein
MEKTFFGILFIIVVIVFFALQNAHPVNIDFWFWNVDSSLSLVLILSIAFGALVSFLLSLPYRLQKNKIIREKTEKIEFLQKEIIELGQKSGTGKTDKAEKAGGTNPASDTKQPDNK